MTGVSSAGDTDRWEALKALALRLTDDEAVAASLDSLTEHQPAVGELLDEGVLVEEGGLVRFLHETLFDHVFARAFAETGRSLRETIVGGPQDLAQRVLVRQVLTYQRGVDRDAYAKAVADLLRDPDVRFHLKDVVFGVLREDEDPDEGEWLVIEPDLLDPESEQGPAAWSVVTTLPWFRVVDRMGRVIRWMASDTAVEANIGLNLVRSIQRSDPRRAATLLAPYVPVSGWRDRIRVVLQSGTPEADRRYFELLLDALDAGVFDDGSRFDDAPLWIAAHDLPAGAPRWAAELLTAYLERGGDLAGDDANPFDAVFPKGEHRLESFVSSAARNEPREFARSVLPLVKRTIDATADNVDGDGTRFGDPWSGLRQITGGHGLAGELFSSLDAAMRALAASKPRSARPLIRSLLEIANAESVRYLVYRAWARNPAQFGGDAVAHLTSKPPPFRCGYADSPYWVTGELIGALQDLPTRQVRRLERAILLFTPAWERRADNRLERGLAQWTLLQAFDRNRLSPEGRRRRDELARKFEGVSVRPRGVQVGFVGPPIPEQQARKMTDRDWLRAIARYNTDENREWLKGGAIELSQVLEQATKADGERFAKLALRFDARTNDNYAEAVLRGLGDLPQEVPAELLFDVIRHFFDLPSKPGGRWLARPLAKVADQEIPDDLLDIVAWYATKHPDPERDTWSPESADDVEYYGGDPFAAGINSVRGVGAEALSALIWPNGSRIERLRPALSAVVRDRTVAVRTCAAVALQSTARHDQALAIDLFLELVDANDVLLAARPVENFLSYMAGRNLAQLKPVLDRMVLSQVPAVREAGGRQAALAALSDESAENLVRAALGSDTPARKGVATVSASNVRHREVGPRCKAWLVPLFDDDDREVRDEAARWTHELGPRDLQRLRDVARAFIASQAYRDDESGMLHALQEATVPVADLAIEAVRVFLDEEGRGVADFQQRATIDAHAASELVIRAYSSASSWAMKSEALDLIDRLMAARVAEMARLVEAYDSSA